MLDAVDDVRDNFASIKLSFQMSLGVKESARLWINCAVPWVTSKAESVKQTGQRCGAVVVIGLVVDDVGGSFG